MGIAVFWGHSFNSLCSNSFEIYGLTIESERAGLNAVWEVFNLEENHRRVEEEG